MDPFIEFGVGLITGAGSGIGQEIALLLAERGCSKFFLADIDELGLDDTRKKLSQSWLKAQTIKHVTDVSNDASVMTMIKRCTSIFGRLDFAINCAGIARGSIKTINTALEEFERICNVNEKGVFLCEKHEISQILTQHPISIPGYSPERAVRGVIVNIASIAATAGLSGLAAYTSSKHGVLGLAKVDAPHQIRINCVSPGFVNTPMVSRSGLSEEYLATMEAQSPMNRMTLAREVAEAAVFLASGCASGITGSNLIVDAGANLFHVVVIPATSREQLRTQQRPLEPIAKNVRIQ